jgi:hypothetical protein
MLMGLANGEEEASTAIAADMRGMREMICCRLIGDMVPSHFSQSLAHTQSIPPGENLT